MPVTIDGMVVMPGDLLVGDADGLLAIRPDEAPAIAARVRAIAESEAKVLQDIERGALDRGWVDATLKARGVL
ncbi:hypothetical protein D3C86_1889250 [compost metagenome]